MVKMFLTDCDGCLTDGGMYYTESGDEFKKFHTYDGMGFQILRDNGIITGIITGENTKIVEKRAKKIRADILIQGASDKLSSVKELCKKYDVTLDDIAYVGDDINDLETIKNVGYGCSVANAMECVKKEAVYVSQLRGGDGAVREIIEWVLNENETI